MITTKHVGRFLTAGLIAVTFAQGSCSNTHAVGRVVDRWALPKYANYTLIVKRADGHRVKVRTYQREWSRCHIGDYYPDCERQP